MIGAVLALALAAVPLRPDPALTPGAVDHAAVLAVVCVRGHTSAAGVRHVTAATKRRVFAAYRLDPHGTGAPFEIDHLISLELGGSNDPANLWPQSYVTPGLNAHLKDALENRLHALVCAGKVPLPEAQHDIATDWPGAYVRFVGPLN